MRKEIKLFILFFLTSLVFTYWTSWNEETNFALTKAIVNHESFYLDSFQNITGDRFYINDHYVAHLHRLGFSSLSTSIYFSLKFLTRDENLIKFLLSILVSSLFSSLSILVFYKLSRNFLRNELHRASITASYGFSTLLFQQARIFTFHSVESFFVLLTFYLFSRFFWSKKIRNIIICGILAGFSLILTHLFGVLFFLFLLFFLIKNKKKESLIFFLTAMSTFLPNFLGYLFSVGSTISYFLPFSGKFLNYTHLSFFPKTFKGDHFPLSSFLQLLAFPSKGILFYYPVLIFALVGFFLIKTHKMESLISLLFIFFVLLWISINVPGWWSGWVSYGPSRLLTILMPFLAIGLAGFVNKFGFKILIPFIFVSLLNNFLLLQYGEDKISILSWEEYKCKMEHFQILSNPLFEHYLPLTLINGPRSILLENLIIDKKVSIDFKHPYNPVTPDFIPPGSPIMKKFEVYLFALPKVGIITLKLPWLSLFILIFILLLIWKNEIFSKIRMKSWIIFLILILIFLFSFIRVTNFTYGDNWCAPLWHETEKRMENSRWMGKNATIILFSKEKLNKTLKLNVEGLGRNETFEIYLNKKIIGNYTIEKQKEILQPLELREGENEIFLKSKGECVKPWKIGVSCDLNCISLKISNIQLLNF